MITTTPFDPRGYVVGETPGVQVTFSEAVTVSGSPVPGLGIGEDVREAVRDEAASVGAFVAFRYVVMLEDRDEDGISIDAGALHASDGTIQNANGLAADIDIGDHSIADDGDQLIPGAPPSRSCGDERSLARRFAPAVVREWEGAPFRVDMVRNFPDFVSGDYLLRELGAIGRLADQIEGQLGYRIAEMGDLIEVPTGTPADWDQNFERYWRNGLLPRERGQLLAFYRNDDNQSRDGAGSPMSAPVCCGTTSYNRRFFRPPHGTEWTGPNSPAGETIVRELFHLIGFIHVRADSPVGVPMSFGGLHLSWETGSPIYCTTWTDIDNLRCIFPEGG